MMSARLIVFVVLGTIAMLPAAALGATGGHGKPVRPGTISIINVPPPVPRGVPGPVAGAGLPAALIIGLYAWFKMRRVRTTAVA